MAREKIPAWLRLKVMLRDHFCCMYCGNRPPWVRLEVDHFVPVAAGGTNDVRNLITACRDCNGAKSDKAIEWGKPDGQRYEPKAACSCSRPTCGGPEKGRDELEDDCDCRGCHGCDACGSRSCHRARYSNPVDAYGGDLIGGCETVAAVWNSALRGEENFFGWRQLRKELQDQLRDDVAEQIRRSAAAEENDSGGAS